MSAFRGGTSFVREVRGEPSRCPRLSDMLDVRHTIHLGEEEPRLRVRTQALLVPADGAKHLTYALHAVLLQREIDVLRGPLLQCDHVRPDGMPGLIERILEVF